MTKSIKNLWQTQNYYQKASKASDNSLNHPALLEIARLSKVASRILEVGCGDGTKLALLTLKSKKRFGVDISKKAIDLAKNKYKDMNFFQGDVEKGLTFKNQSFDLVYSAFVLEHLSNPEKFLKEAIRLTEINGKIVFVAPNFGAPNRASPCFKSSRIEKLLLGFLKDFLAIGKDFKDLDWLKVRPRINEKYQSDFDTTVEPYLLTLQKFLEKNGIKTLKASSLWNEESISKFHQKVFRLLAKLRIHPFYYWGPHLFYVGEKK